MSTRRNLVVVRAGDSSLHPQWLPQSGDRNWDLIVSYYGDDPDRYRAQDIRRIDGKGPKWRGVTALFNDHPDIIDAYDYIWLPDDDIATSAATINALFDYMKRFDLELAQPSLSILSYYSWAITLQNPTTDLRWTNFVETMVPCFSSNLLKKCLPTFAPYISGWGLDWVWPKLTNKPSDSVAILDRIAVTHTRPFGGPNYAFFKEKPYTAFDEADHVAAQYEVDIFTTNILRIRTAGGLRLNSTNPLAKLTMTAGMVLNIARAYATRSPQRWKIDKHLRRHLQNPLSIRENVREQSSLFQPDYTNGPAH